MKILCDIMMNLGTVKNNQNVYFSFFLNFLVCFENMLFIEGSANSSCLLRW